MPRPTDAVTPAQNDDPVVKRPTCGVVRPIAGIDGYPDGHWSEVHEIIVEAADTAGFDARLVSDDEAIGVILGRIVTNLHDLPITVIDVSGLNPNVFFELGMRLAFDKPVVVIKDDITRYPFDASPIEYIPYPADLRHGPLMKFKAKLTIAIERTTAAFGTPEYRSFLKHFGSVKPGELGDDQSFGTALILEELRSLRPLIKRFGSETASLPSPPSAQSKLPIRHMRYRVKLLDNTASEIVDRISSVIGIVKADIEIRDENMAYLNIYFRSGLIVSSNIRDSVIKIITEYGGIVLKDIHQRPAG